LIISRSYPEQIVAIRKVTPDTKIKSKEFFEAVSLLVVYRDDKLIDLGATNVASIEFWTENYLMILLSTGYLLYSSIDEIKKTSPQTKVLDLFEKYMDLHLNIAGPGKAGIFEILSPSYTTHTQWSAF
jgi:hypothetical protein